MEGDFAEILGKFEMQIIESVLLRADEITFRFRGGSLNCVRLPSIHVRGAELPLGSGDWLLALWRSIGERPTCARLEPGRLTFTLGEHVFTIDLEAPDHPSPESAILSFEDAWAVY